MMENVRTQAHVTVSPPSKILRAYRATRTLVSKRVAKIIVPDAPHFDSESTVFFESIITQAKNYLEYGSGGSTLLAHRNVRHLVSVESDRRFLRAVERKLGKQRLGAETTLIHVNIGLTEDWGKPIFTTPTPRRLRRWRRYAQSPWSYFQRLGLTPDLILIDGRFRAACALESLLNLPDGSECRILMDDYVTRQEYRVVEEVADLTEMKGRMAVFRMRPHMDRIRCKQLAEQLTSDYR